MMIDLYTAPTPNGYKISIALEELGLAYKVHEIDLSKLVQKEDWYLKLNPNGRIPVIKDNDNGTVLFETGAILLYLAEKTGKLMPALNSGNYWTAIQWLMFQMSGIGPMQGQVHLFKYAYPVKHEDVIERYFNETRRLYNVLETCLSGSSYLIKDGLSIVDIAVFPWLARHEKTGLDLNEFGRLKVWFEMLSERPAFKAGMLVPRPS